MDATRGAGQLCVSVYLAGKPLKAMIDSRATGNFISEDVVEKERIPTKVKQNLYELYMIDGRVAGGRNKKVIRETKTIELRRLGHSE